MPDDVQTEDFAAPAPPTPNQIPVRRPPPVEQVAGPGAVPLPSSRMIGFTPPQAFTDPAYQQKIEQQQMQIYRNAQNVKQAEQDVASARKMLGILKADREIKSGVPVDQAMYRNLQFFLNPADKGFAGTVKALRPPPTPYATNFPGIPAPAVIDARGTPHWMPQSAKPSGPEDTGPVQAVPVLMPDGKPVPGHVAVRSGKANKIISVKDPEQMGSLTIPQQQSAIAAASSATARLLQTANARGDEEGVKEYTSDLKGYRKQLDELRKPKSKSETPPEAPATDRVRVKSKDGKIGTIPKSQLPQAQKAGYILAE